MANALPPPPVNDKPGSFAWLEWYRQLRAYVSTSGSVPWFIINFAGSNITDIALRDHNQLQNVQGGGANEKYHMSQAQHEGISHTSWNSSDGTLNIAMGNNSGVTQQVGLEHYMIIDNHTGSTFQNGKVIGFDGASDDRIDGHLMIADGTMLSTHTLGITTQTITSGDTGYVTTFGYVRDLDTSSWTTGDVLYVSPTTAGNLTNVKPTAPNIVIPIATVVVSHATTGIIAVNPIITLGLFYGTFYSSATQTAAAINTAYAATLNNTTVSNGVTIGSPTSRLVCSVSGLYDFTANVQAVKSSAAVGYLWVWARKNGVDIANSATKIAIQGSTGEATVSRSFPISMNETDYFELMWAVDSTAISLQANAATAFCPATPSVTVLVAQINQ